MRWKALGGAGLVAGGLLGACAEDREGLPSFADGVHGPGFADPGAPTFHSAMLRAERWAPMLDPSTDDACGRCHEGAPARPAGVTVAAPDAPPCTKCHDQPGGVLACSTCHGSGDRGALSGAHSAHVSPSPVRSVGLPCSACHPVPGTPVIGGQHGDGTVEVIFDPTLVPGEKSYDTATHACAVSCHDRGGVRTHLAWNDTMALGCRDCHESPAAGHYPGACNRCHAESNAAGTALSGGPLHVNGRVDLGDGSGRCGACHGSGDSPWPTTAAHPAHQSPVLAEPIACTSCHVVTASVLDARHLDGTVHVEFSGLANARGSLPTWDGTRCAGVACHGANLADPASMPAWKDSSGAQSRCGACHGIPPSEHTPSTSCDRADCHGGEVSIGVPGPGLLPSITAPGRALHVDGVIETAR
jgi:predicted CxxxxCH...CXXCH cytochrome family protein